MLELLVVVTIIVALCGIAYPVYTSIQRNAAVSATKNLVMAVAAAAANYNHDFVTGQDGHLWHYWMVGQTATDMVTQVTTQIDGDPRLYLAGDPSPLATRAPASYTGLVDMTAFPLPWRANSKGQLVDRWQQPLNIAYDPQKYGRLGLGIWSNGPDQISQGGVSGSDDINSWTGTGDQ